MKPALQMVRRSAIPLAIALVLTACNLPLAGGAGPRAWIDFPANGMSFTQGTIIVQSHSTGPEAIRQVTLYVNGSPQRSDLNPDTSQGLVALSHPWSPPGPGEYSLEVRARYASGAEGRSLPVSITVIGCPAPAGGGPAPASCEPIVPPEVVVGVTLPAVDVPPGLPICVEPTATFTVNANCRSGPGTAYAAAASVLEGASAEIVGKNADGSWLMVRSSGGGACWVSASTLAACGDLASVPVMQAPPPPPAEPPPSAPAAPAGLSVSEHVCQGTTYSVTLSWDDAADNEDGYRVYRNGSLLASLGAGATTYTDSPPQGGPYNYTVEAHNGVGSADASANDAGCLL
jgi:uncharacterized protein YraI